MADNGHQYSEVFNRMGDTMLDTSRQILEINVRTLERLLEQQAELMSQLLNTSTRNVDLAAKAIGYQDLLSGQAQIAQEYGQHMLTGYRRAAEVVSDASKQVAQAVEQAARSTTEEVKQTAEKATRQ